MKIALCSKRFINNDVYSNLNTILQLMEQADSSIDLMCFGEAFLQGFDSLSWKYEIDQNIAVAQDSSVINKIRKKARENEIGVSFGYIEKEGTNIYSSYLVLSKKGETIINFRRVSAGWKEPIADYHYKEGTSFEKFVIDNLSFSVGLCGDLWDESNVEAVSKCCADVVLWPTYLDYSISKWNESEKREYALQAKRFGKKVLLINSICDGESKAKGASAFFSGGIIIYESSMGSENILLVEV